MDPKKGEARLQAIADASPEENRKAVRAILSAAKDVSDAALLLNSMGLTDAAHEVNGDRK